MSRGQPRLRSSPQFPARLRFVSKLHRYIQRLRAQTPPGCATGFLLLSGRQSAGPRCQIPWWCRAQEWSPRNLIHLRYRVRFTNRIDCADSHVEQSRSGLHELSGKLERAGRAECEHSRSLALRNDFSCPKIFHAPRRAIGSRDFDFIRGWLAGFHLLTGRLDNLERNLCRVKFNFLNRGRYRFESVALEHRRFLACSFQLQQPATFAAGSLLAEGVLFDIFQFDRLPGDRIDPMGVVFMFLRKSNFDDSRLLRVKQILDIIETGAARAVDIEEGLEFPVTDIRHDLEPKAHCLNVGWILRRLKAHRGVFAIRRGHPKLMPKCIRLNALYYVDLRSCRNLTFHITKLGIRGRFDDVVLPAIAQQHGRSLPCICGSRMLETIVFAQQRANVIE